MGRKRSTSDLWMPERVYRGRSAFEYHPKGGGNIRLCPLNVDKEEVWEAYRLTKQRLKESLRFTVADMFHNYTHAKQFCSLAPSTQKDYLAAQSKLLKHFANADPNDITTTLFRKYMDQRGQTSEKRANVEKIFFSRAWDWNIQRIEKLKANPIKAVSPFKQQSRDRYVTDQEYCAVFRYATTPVQIAMEIAYLCAARTGDILKLQWGYEGQLEPKKDQTAVVLQHGVYIKQGKTGKAQIKEFTDRLRLALDVARTMNNMRQRSLYVIHTRSGSNYSTAGFKKMFANAKVEAKSTGDLEVNFTFHDLKAKGISEYDGNKQEFSGHKTRSMVERYNRTPDVVKAHDGAINEKQKE